MIAELNLPFGFSVSLKKGIPLSSGMGGSAASAVAAVVAANELLDRSLSREALLPFALAGEAVASGSVHGDNVAPCLFGGLVLALPEPAHGSEHSNLKIVQVPVPDGIVCILVHPEMRIETREARAILRPELPLRSHIQQSACLSGFLAGCYQKDLGLIRAFLRDELIEPQRARLIPGFSELKRLALENGALGFSISGAGPSVFAWAENRDSAQKIEHALVKVFKENGLASQSWVSPVMPQGARRIS
jgi:homoserine kinase